MPDLLAELRAHFPVRESWLYFNHAAVSPMSSPVARAVQAFVRDAVEHGSAHVQAWTERRESTRRQAARLLGARPEEVAFTTNTSQGLLTVAEGLPLAQGDEILMVQDDFPADEIPWVRQERRGARVVRVPRRAGRVHADELLARVGPATRIVALPFVLYDSGQRLDLEQIGAGLSAWAEQQGVPRPLFCVDAIQGLGAFPLDVERAQIDFLSADSHKWMLGLEGIGLFYCRRSRLELLDDPLWSWLSMEAPFQPYHAGKARRPDARRFEYATLPAVALAGLEACLELLHATGIPRMAAAVLDLTEHLAQGLEQRGWSVTTPRAQEAERSGIVRAQPAHGTPLEAVARLAERGVSTTARGGGVRFSPHAWNTHAEVERALDLLP